MENEVSLFVLGDFYPEKSIVDRLNNFGVSDSSNEWINKYLSKADLCIVNLESPITQCTEAIPKTGPDLKGEISGIKFLNNIGCSLVTTANNHIMDYGLQGLEDTLNSLKDHKIESVGSGRTKAEAQQIKYFSKNGLKIAVVNFSENEWSTAVDDDEAGASPLDEISNFYDIQEAKKNADKVIVITHGGHEMYSLPSPRMKRLFRFYIDAGADAVINHHTHCVSGYETFKGKPIFYSLGNFIFENLNYHNSIWNIGMGVSLILSEKTIRFEIVYFKQCDGEDVLIQNLSEEETLKITLKTKEWNTVISSDKLLQLEFDKWVAQNVRQYNSYIEPLNYKIISSLQFRGLFPSLWTAKKRRYLLNLIRCEAHQDVLISILKNENSNT